MSIPPRWTHWPRLPLVLGLTSLGAATFAAYMFFRTFDWVFPQLLHPIRLFDYPPGEDNMSWAIPCTLSIVCGVLSRRTWLGKFGIVLSLLVVSGIAMMAHWGLQQLGEW